MRMTLRLSLALIAVLTILVSSFTEVHGQSKPPDQRTAAEWTSLRDSFVDQVTASRFSPTIAAPEIILDTPPEFGRYEPQKNILHLATWDNLGPEQKEIFEQFASRSHGKESSRIAFDNAMRWIAIHELGHWWQASTHTLGESHFAIERGANRIAGAYWRMHNPSLVEWIRENASASVDMFPNPVPKGQGAGAYFDANYEKLQPPEYFWYQYRMILDVLKEKPTPTFREALQHPTFP